jgi:fructose-1,6-bisphosphatase/inositol monophosphatase family enzyme
MPISAADFARLRAILKEAAETEILPRFKRLGDGDVSTKSGPLDFVTIADQAAERLIAARVRVIWPEIVFVGEESTAEDPSLLDRLDAADLAIVVDPIDGTFNFANGLPLFGVMAAIIENGITIAAAIYDPFARDCAYAALGQGAFLEHEDGSTIPLKVAAPAAVREMHGCFGWQYLPEPYRTRGLSRQPMIASSYAYRCAAHEYRLAAGGGCHFVVYGKLMPWDHVPGILIHKEAGGHAALLDGSPYLPSTRHGILLLAPDAKSWHDLAIAFFKE